MGELIGQSKKPRGHLEQNRRNIQRTPNANRRSMNGSDTDMFPKPENSIRGQNPSEIVAFIAEGTEWTMKRKCRIMQGTSDENDSGQLSSGSKFCRLKQEQIVL